MIRVRLLAAAAAVAVVTAACGGADDTASEVDEPVAAPTTAAPTTEAPTTTGRAYHHGTHNHRGSDHHRLTHNHRRTDHHRGSDHHRRTHNNHGRTDHHRFAPTTAAQSAIAVEPSGVEPVATAGQWSAFNGGEDCICADGSDYHYWVREGDPTKLVFYLQGGGACFTRDNCAFTGPTNTYDTNTDITQLGDNPSEWGGIFDFDNPLNPVKDHSFVVALYCTGDVHLGNRTNDYGDGLIVHHRGFVNANTALDSAVERFGDATEVVVAGSSAGSASAALYGGLAADLFEGASIAVVADASGAYPSDPGINTYVGGLWGTSTAIPDWPVNEGVTIAEYGLPELFIRTGTHAPHVRFARYDNAFDRTQEFYAALGGFDASSIDKLMYQNEALIEAAGVNQASYMAPGRDHTILFRNLLYTQEVEGVAFLDWLTAFLAGTDVDDVACVDCS